MRRTFLTSALDMPEIMSYIYNKSWKLQFNTSSSIIIIEESYLQTFLHSLNEILRFLVKSVGFFVYYQEDADNSFTLFSNVFFTDSGERFITRLRLI